MIFSSLWRYGIIKIKNMRILFLISIFCISSMAVQAQKSIYKGDFEWQGEFKGTAEYEYIKDRSGKEIPDGKFHFFLVERDSVNQARLLKKDFSGLYKNNEKTGQWAYVWGVYDVIVSDVVEFEVKAELEAEVVSIKGNYEKDLPKGAWIFKEQSYKDEKISTLAHTKELSFNQGWFSGEFEYEEYFEGKTLGIKGILTPEGFMDSVWMITYLKNDQIQKEKRIYDKGILLDIFLLDPETDQIVQHVEYEASKQKLKQLKEEKDPGFKISEKEFGVRFNNGYRRRDLKYTVQLDANAYLESIIKNLLRFDLKSYYRNGELVKYPIKTRRFQYPASMSDEEDFQKINELYESLKTKTANQLNSKAFGANRQKSDSLAFAFAFFQSLNEKLKNFENIIDIFSSGRIRYVDQSIYTKDGLEYLQSYDTIEYNFGGELRQKVIDQRQVIESANQLVSSIKSYLEYENELVDKLIANVYSTLEQMEIDSSVSEFELRVLNKKEIVDDLYFNGNYLSNKHEQVIRRIRYVFLGEELDKLSGEFERASSYLQKVQKAEQMLKLLNDLDAQYEVIYTIFEQRDDIDELYYENFFNAFTYSSYDQRAKERLYKAGNEKLFNHYINEWLQVNTLQEMEEIIGKIQELQTKMFTLREQDTRKLERRLRRNNKPTQIESALGL